MAIGAGSLIEIISGGVIQGQNWMNVFTYVVDGEIGSPTAANYGEAWWNHVKTTYRALITSAHTTAFQYVKVREMDELTGEYGEYAVPTGEQAGTGPTSSTTYLPLFNAAAIRLTVGTRVTRPGQKRIPGQRGEDISSIQWVSSYITKLDAFGAVIAASASLGAPAAGTQIDPVVVKRDPSTGLPITYQAVTGWLTNPYVSSQVSRKFGKGN